MNRRTTLKNRTHWSSADLSRLVRAGLAHAGAGWRSVEVSYRRIGGILGKASLPPPWDSEGRRIWLYLPRAGALDVRDLADTVAHEVAHTLGVRHREMIGGRCCGGFDVSWADGLTVGQDRPEPAHRHRVEGCGNGETMIWCRTTHRRDCPWTPPPVNGAALAAARAERARQVVEARERKARAALDRWERKAKAAARKVREYRTRVRYYERTAAARAAGGAS